MRGRRAQLSLQVLELKSQIRGLEKERVQIGERLASLEAQVWSLQGAIAVLDEFLDEDEASPPMEV